MPLLNVLEATTADQRALLARVGFVRVDGLGTYERKAVMHEDNKTLKEFKRVLHYVIKGGEDVSAGALGRWGYNNGQLEICTLGGERWLRKGYDSHNSQIRELLRDILGELAPRGEGLWVSCSNGEQLTCEQVRMRLADPDWMPDQGDLDYGTGNYHN